MKLNCILFKSTYSDWGFFFLRIGIGFMFILHGFPKITAGIETWNYLGQSMSFLGIGSGYTFFGFLAAFSEAIGGLFLILGLLTRLGG